MRGEERLYFRLKYLWNDFIYSTNCNTYKPSNLPVSGDISTAQTGKCFSRWVGVGGSLTQNLP